MVSGAMCTHSLICIQLKESIDSHSHHNIKQINRNSSQTSKHNSQLNQTLLHVKLTGTLQK